MSLIIFSDFMWSMLSFWLVVILFCLFFYVAESDDSWLYICLSSHLATKPESEQKAAQPQLIHLSASPLWWETISRVIFKVKEYRLFSCGWLGLNGTVEPLARFDRTRLRSEAIFGFQRWRDNLCLMVSNDERPSPHCWWNECSMTVRNGLWNKLYLFV